MKTRNEKIWMLSFALLFAASSFFAATVVAHASVTQLNLSKVATSSAGYETLFPVTSEALSIPPRTLLIVDEGVDNYQVLVDDLTASYSKGQITDTLVLNDSENGLDQISDWLASTQTTYDAVHVISHAIPGAIKLGSFSFDVHSLSDYRSDLLRWRSALEANADILFYGCDLTANAQGLELVSMLSEITQADIAASSNTTGASFAGADWTLETVIGKIDTPSLSSNVWGGTLGDLVIQPVGYPVRESDGAVSGEPDGSGLSLLFAQGDSAIWTNAGTAGSEEIDIRATVVSFTDNSGDGSGAISFSTQDDDLWVQINKGDATVLWEVFLSGGGQSVTASGNPIFTIADIDGNGSGSAFPTLQVEAVIPDVSSLTSYTLDSPTNLEAGLVGNDLYVRGTQNESGGSTSLVGFRWNSVTSWTIGYEASSVSAARYFIHDGDGDLEFSSPATVGFLTLDLDANDSSVAGNDFVASVFDELGTQVSVTDVDPAISTAAPLNSTLDSASILISNSYPGDELLVNGSDAASGSITIGPTTLSYTNTASGTPTVVITGSGTLSEYESALTALSYRNTSAAVYFDPRLIQVSVTDDEQATTSNIALGIVSVNPDTDGDSYLNDVDLDDDNDGVLDSVETPSDPMADNDGDGYPAYLDDDDADVLVGDDDGTTQEPFDSDRDGIPNHLDLDSDNDGIPDNIEAQVSASYLPPNNAYDGSGVDTAYAGGIDRLVNIDGDLSDDMFDLDSDNDGISDTAEAGLSLGVLNVGVNGLDDAVEAGDDYTDTNGSFDTTPINDLPDADNSGGEPDWRDPQDFDQDSFAGNVDIDDDNDGIIDRLETGIIDQSNFDSGDLTFSGIWRDNSFFASGFLGVLSTEGEEYLFASNSDVGVGDTFGTASGTLNTSGWLQGETSFALDVSYPDLGADAFATFTITLYSGLSELGTLTGAPPVLDGSSTYSLDTYLTAAQIAEGISIEISVPLTGENALVVMDNLQVTGSLDFDLDGVPDHTDLDSDNDGIPDNVEAQLTASYVGPANNDADMDGLDDNYEFSGDEGLTPVSTGSLNEVDYLDTDSDGDSISDSFEAGLFLGVLNVGVNGWDDSVELSDDYSDPNGAFDTPATDFPDTDSDALAGGDVNYRDTDSDGDGVLDSAEDSSLALPAVVGDGNGNDVDDSVDVAFTMGVDANGNNVDDAFEPTDTDSDGVSNYLDLDSDNDGLLDSVETNTDTDVDGFANFLDLDSDNDGLPDNVEAQATASYVAPSRDEVNPSGYSVDVTGVNVAYTGGLTPVNTDGSDDPDYIDTDSDNDGDNDTVEAELSLNTLNVGANGLDDDVENTDDYLDVNGTVVQGLNGVADLPSQSGAGDVKFRALTVPTVANTASSTSTPTLIGTHDSDAELAVTVNMMTYTEGDGSLVDTGSDTWSLIVPVALADGTYNVSAVSTLGPLSSADFSTNELTVDTVLPVLTAQDIGPTNDQSPEFNGTTEEDPGAVVTVTDSGGGVLCTATVVFGDPNAWMCSPEGGLAEGTTALNASVTDPNGNTTTVSFNVEIDVTPYSITATDVGPTAETMPEAFGTTDAPIGTVVTVERSGGGAVCSTTVSSGIEENAWACSPSVDFAEGVNSMTAKVIDDAGNTGSDTFTVTIETASHSITLNPVATDDVINGLEDDFSLIVSGSSQEAGLEEVTVTANGVSYVTTTDSGGSWSVTVPALDIQAFGVVETVTAVLSAMPVTASSEDSRTVTRDGDADNDGIPDQIEAGSNVSAPVDSDGDSIADYLDTDSDNDGIPDSVEEGVTLGVDSDGDGIDDVFDVDAMDGPDVNGDGIADNYVLTDSDLDGTANYIDLDSDNDGIIDLLEAGVDALNPVDSDNDGAPDYQDSDSDNDTIADDVEAGVLVVLSGVDSDSDGIDDAIDSSFTDGLDANANGVDDVSEPVDTDNDGLADYIDLDADSDGISDISEGANDTDGDGLDDYRDIDSDGDGILDSSERGSDVTFSGSDVDSDGIDDSIDTSFVDGSDVNSNGIDDAAEPVDTDGDGLIDALDIDSDGDGIVDNIEAQSTAGYVPPDGSDVDQDGLDDAYDANTNVSTNDSDSSEGVTPFVTGTGSLPDYLNFDADGDGVSDTLEAYGTIDSQDVDSDADGLDDAFDDYDNLSVPDLIANVTNNSQSPVDFVDTNDDAGNAGGESDWRDGVDNTGTEGTEIDTDGDGIPDLAGDLDDDNDGILDTEELSLNVDLDGDGIPNNLDLDSDNDGIDDNVEAQNSASYIAPTVDGTGASVVDSTGVNVAYTGGLTPVDTDGSTTDGDGTQTLPDYLDTDSDGDGLADALEAGGDSTNPPDSDNDGLPDYVDTDADNDGIADSVENAGAPPLSGIDSDFDGIDDALDVDQTGGEDVNGDGIDDRALPDEDGDGVSNYLDRDSDNDGVNDTLEIGDNPAVPNDTDSDGTPDYLDTDADNDGIPDVIENGFSALLSGIDSDGDGIDDVVDVDATGGPDENGNGVDDTLEPLDTDGDGVPDFADPDSDNDGIPDAIEASNVPEMSGNDADGDGVDDAFDVQFTGGTDVNADGVDDLAQPVDTNMDGLPDYQATDSDTDGIPDRIEADTSLLDSDGNGIYDRFDVRFTGGVDANGDGIDDAVGVTDTDGDSIPDYLDIDSDNDGLTDVSESGLLDSNGDGIVDAGQQTDAPRNTDGTDVPDYRDLDSDNDGVFDLIAAGFAIFDVDEDGIIDDTSDVDGDGVPDSVDGQPGSFSAGRDFDGDGVLDFLDLDSDNDGIPNAVEAPDGNFGQDTDTDGIPDYLDLDSDNDGVSDLIESGINLTDANKDGQVDAMIDSNSDGLDDSIDVRFIPDDTDGDGTFGFQDLDNDGDGISDLIESGASEDLDANGDGMIDTVALGDADFDGMLDVIDPEVEGGIAGTAITPIDTDGDGSPDFKDLDSDGDNVTDQSESGDVNNDGVPDRLQVLDSVAPFVPQASGGGSGSTGVLAVFLLLLLLLRRSVTQERVKRVRVHCRKLLAHRDF